MKRVFDFVLSASGLLVLSPLLLIVALITRLYDGGPAFFVQERVGLKGRPFRMIKFRSMVAAKPGGSGGAAITVGRDPRITPLGRLLRLTKIDELPQLWNVVCGDMSLVGPRPEIAKYVAIYTLEQRAVLALRPGITDPASLVFFDEAALLARAADPERFYRERVVPEKIRLNLEYAAKANLWTDFMLILATVLRAAGVNMDILRRLNIAGPDFDGEL